MITPKLDNYIRYPVYGIPSTAIFGKVQDSNSPSLFQAPSMIHAYGGDVNSATRAWSIT